MLSSSTVPFLSKLQLVSQQETHRLERVLYDCSWVTPQHPTVGLDQSLHHKSESVGWYVCAEISPNTSLQIHTSWNWQLISSISWALVNVRSDSHISQSTSPLTINCWCRVLTTSTTNEKSMNETNITLTTVETREILTQYVKSIIHTREIILHTTTASALPTPASQQMGVHGESNGAPRRLLQSHTPHVDCCCSFCRCSTRQFLVLLVRWPHWQELALVPRSAPRSGCWDLPHRCDYDWTLTSDSRRVCLNWYWDRAESVWQGWQMMIVLPQSWVSVSQTWMF